MQGRWPHDFSNEPCTGGDLIPGTTAAAGFDTRPSDRLARLVAAGRVPPIDSLPDTRNVGAAPVAIVVTSSCAAMRQQIMDIDTVTRRPNDTRWLDDWRRTRQDIRTQMARLHC